METKAVTEDFYTRDSTPYDIQSTMLSIEQIFTKCDDILANARMPMTGYVKQTEEIEKVYNGMCILNQYVGSAHSQAYSALDHPLFLGFSKGATETLSQINLSEITTENSFNMEEHYLIEGSQYSTYEYGKRIKSELTMEDFMGLGQWGEHEWLPTLDNMETVGIFAELFRMDYRNMDPADIDVNEYLEGFLASGEFDHKAYHPVRDFVSAVADVTIILPLIESIVGYDFITGEDLTDLECGLKAGGAIVDLLTFGNGAILTDAARAGMWQFAGAVLKTMAVDALGSGAAYLTGEMLEELGLPPGSATILTAIVSGGVTYSAGKYFFKNAAGEVVGEYTEAELEKIVKGEIKDVEVPANTKNVFKVNDLGEIGSNKKIFTENPFDEAGNLKPNVKYQAGEFKYNYETDTNGGISNWNTDNLQLTNRTDRLKHNPDTPGKIDGDHAGHLAGDRFGGSPN